MVYPRVSLYALMLAAAGIPLYIHLPRFAAVNLGIGLGTIGTILLLIRLVDLVQDPLIGWAIDRWPKTQGFFAMIAAVGLAIGFPLLFSPRSGDNIVTQIVLILILLFSAYSIGMILLYGRTASLAERPEPSEMMKLSAYREAGMLAGVILAAISPAIFAGFGSGNDGYPAFGLFLGAIAVLSAIITRPIWQRPVIIGKRISITNLARAGGLRLLGLALVNSLPVAITSTLFLFFVEDRLELVGQAGPLLILFFLSAGLSVPLWARLSNRVGGKNTLLIAMPLSIIGFVGAAFLAAGNLLGFAAICIASGIALGADMVVLPTMFLVALYRAGLNASSAFGIWSFAGKLGLALAAFIALPLLSQQGFQPGQTNSPQALTTLNTAYAIIPCILKLIALGYVLTLPKEEPKP
jgi:Na+/melibiose symporter-like transporter